MEIPASASPQAMAYSVPLDPAENLAGPSRGLAEWLHSGGFSLAFTTYQSSQLYLMGTTPTGRLTLYAYAYAGAMGLAAGPERLWLGAPQGLWRLDNALAPRERAGEHDRFYAPRAQYLTGHLDIHDLAVDRHGRLLFINTLYGCLATLGESQSFRPLWQPPFLSRLAPEDRCHLNGLALVNGEPRYVTCVSRSDVADGWRDRRRDGGLVLDVVTHQAVAEGLSMPHSPRWYRGRLWLLNSGTGELGWIDTGTGRFEPLCFCPGYARGLAFWGDCAIVGLSLPRDRTFGGLELDERLRAKDTPPRCGLWVVDLRNGDVRHWLRFEGMVQEIYDVQVLPGVACPLAMGSDDLDRLDRVIRPESGAACHPAPWPGHAAGAGSMNAEGQRPRPEGNHGPSAADLFRQAQALKQAERWDEAADTLAELILRQPAHALAHNTLGIVRQAQGREDEAAACFDHAIRLAPHLGRPYANRANLHRRNGDLDAAEHGYRTALDLEPGYLPATLQLAHLLLYRGRVDEADSLFEAIAAGLGYRSGQDLPGLGDEQRELLLDALLNRVSVAYRQGWEAIAQERAAEIRRLAPGQAAEAYVIQGVALMGLDRPDQALACFDRALARQADNARALYSRALALFRLGRLEDAWAGYERRFEVFDYALMPVAGHPQWRGEPLRGRTLLVHAEQGLGDTLQFVRYLPRLDKDGGKVLFACPPELCSVLSAIEGIDEVIAIQPENAARLEFELWTPLLNLPRWVAPRLADIPGSVPYLRADPDQVDRWRGRFQKGRHHLGLVWAGNPRHRTDIERSCRLADLAPLAALADTKFYSLQKGKAAAEAPPPGLEVMALGEDLHDFGDTAAAVMALDGVVTVDTAVAHLAGALGRPVWLLVAYAPDWRWLHGRADSPWYPTLRMFRQPRPGDWAGAVEALASALGVAFPP